MFVSLGRTQTWRFHTKLYKFWWHTFANTGNAQMKNSRDLIFGEVGYYQSSIVSQILDLIHWMVTIFSFDYGLVKTENRILRVKNNFKDETEGQNWHLSNLVKHSLRFPRPKTRLCHICKSWNAREKGKMTFNRIFNPRTVQYTRISCVN